MTVEPVDISSFPAFPPGFWRRLVIDPERGDVVVAALEDDAHCLSLALFHEGGRVTRVSARTERVPYTTCPGASEAIAAALTGLSLDALAGIDPREQCTHLFDLAVAAATYAGAAQAVRYDMRVADRVGERTTASIDRDGEPLFAWQLEGTTICGPGDWTGRDLRRLSVWKSELDAPTALATTLLRRAVYVSGVRRQPDRSEMKATDYGLSRQGVCFTHQMPRALDAVRREGWRKDFSRDGSAPLEGFIPEIF